MPNLHLLPSIPGRTGAAAGSSGPASVGRCIVLLTLLCLVLTGCGGDDSPAMDRTLASVTLVSGDGQQAAAGTALAQPLVARLLNAAGQPIPSRSITFAVAEGGGSVFTSTVTSDAGGNARDVLTVGTAIGPQAVEVRDVNASGQAVVFATFHATAVAGAPAALALVSGDGQTAIQLQALSAPIVVQVSDAHGNPVAGIEVTFSPSDGGHAGSGTAATDALGQASTTWTAGLPIKTQTMTAAVAGVAVVMASAVITQAAPGAPANIAIVSGDGQSITQNSLLGTPFVVMVTDNLGNPVPGQVVDFVAAPGSAIVSHDTQSSSTNEVLITTNAEGTAGWWNFIHGAGTQQVTASTAGLAAVTFTVHSTPTTHLYDGYYTCPVASGGQFNLLVSGGLLVPSSEATSSLEPTFLSSSTLDESTGNLTAQIYVGPSSTVIVTGQLSVAADSTQLGSGAGTYTDTPVFGPPWTSAWTCARQ